MENQIKNKNKEICNLKESIQNLKSEHEKNIYNLYVEHEQEINKIKFFNEANLNKIENANHIEKLNEIMYNKILELENKIDSNEKEEMLEFLNSSRIKKINETINLREKMNYLQKNELINELEYQSYQIEDLLKQREHLDKIINEYKNDIKIHSEIEKNLAKKNKKYTDFIKILSFRDNDLDK